MEIIILIYVLISFILSTLVLSQLISIKIKFRSKIITNYFVLYLLLYSFQLLKLTKCFYLRIDHISCKYLNSIFEILSLSLIYFIPNFINVFFKVTFKKILNTLFLLLAVICISCNILSNLTSLNIIEFNIVAILFTETIYCIIIYFLYYKKIDIKIYYDLGKTIHILLVFLIIGLIFKTIFQSAYIVYSFYTFFIIMNLINIYFIFKHLKIHDGTYGIGLNYKKCFKLTQRENEVITLLLLGKSSKEISQILLISVPTVKTYISSIYKKTKTGSRYELISIISTQGYNYNYIKPD